ncbi:MAG: mannitol dehydrogenase family protein [Gemmobacter sp.]
MTRLSQTTLPGLPADVARPRYDRAAVRTGIVHLGVGAFHRAHQAVFADDCLNAGATDWGIAAASLRSPDTRDALAPQDGLYTLALRENDHQSLRVVGSIATCLVAPENPAALLAAMADPAVRIVSLTVTEKGYTADVATGDLRLDDRDVQHDLAHPDAPRTALGFVIRALALRRRAGQRPFTVLSCDNLPGNGHLTHRALVQFAAAADPSLGRFIADEVACPSCMVDRIVPATTDADRDMIAARLGVRDAWPVLAEPFFQWVIEDRFPAGRPEWERSGVEFVTDVASHEAMKLRLLNGAHSTIAAMGRVAGLATVAYAMADPAIRATIRAYWAEVAPAIAPGIDVAAYTARLQARFDNSALHHRCAQIAMDASLKLPQRIVAPLRELHGKGRKTPMLTFALAAWMRSCQGVAETGAAMPLSDPPLQGWTGLPGPDLPVDQTVRAFAGFAPVFGPGLEADLAAGVAAALADMRLHGIRAAATRRLATLT